MVTHGLPQANEGKLTFGEKSGKIEFTASCPKVSLRTQTISGYRFSPLERNDKNVSSRQFRRIIVKSCQAINWLSWLRHTCLPTFFMARCSGVMVSSSSTAYNLQNTMLKCPKINASFQLLGNYGMSSYTTWLTNGLL